MPEVLFFEILTTTNENMVKCFKKFPEIENPVAFVPNVGSLIRYETEKDSPCSPIDTQFLQIRYVFNERLAKNQFIFTEEQKASLKEWKASTNEGTGGFIEKATVTDGWFPELSDYKPGESPNIITDAMDMVATDLDFLRKIYSQLRDEIYETYKALWPEPHRIGKDWILLRHLQVHLLAIRYIVWVNFLSFRLSYKKGSVKKQPYQGQALRVLASLTALTALIFHTVFEIATAIEARLPLWLKKLDARHGSFSMTVFTHTKQR